MQMAFARVGAHARMTSRERGTHTTHEGTRQKILSSESPLSAGRIIRELPLNPFIIVLASHRLYLAISDTRRSKPPFIKDIGAHRPWVRQVDQSAYRSKQFAKS